jgi:putative spermidine/putrescine transport system permease protein
LIRSRARAFGLAFPLLAFILVLFVYPIANFFDPSLLR